MLEKVSVILFIINLKMREWLLKLKCLKFFKFCIGVELIYNVVFLVYSIVNHVCIYIYLFFFGSFPI